MRCSPLFQYTISWNNRYNFLSDYFSALFIRLDFKFLVSHNSHTQSGDPNMGQGTGREWNGWCHHLPVKVSESTDPEELARRQPLLSRAHMFPCLRKTFHKTLYFRPNIYKLAKVEMMTTWIQIIISWLYRVLFWGAQNLSMALRLPITSLPWLP